MPNIIYQGKTINFLELLGDHKIEIPIIQRDYAQGRTANDDIRQEFLNALKESLINKNPIKLDFIYGSTFSNTFLPLDGQQRLTTLFLLHWYAVNKYAANDEMYHNLLSKFSYETRISSREFCHALINNNINILDVNKSISDIIIDSNWFFLSWKKDPTISSMLRTIDDIHAIFFDIPDLWECLKNQNLISFYFVELENIGLTDDLYIKMNARGKLLTPFENFKAGLQKKAIDNKWEKKANHTEEFSFKIDTIWTDFFWTNFKKNNSVDTAHMRFIATIAMIRAVLEKSEERFQTVQKLNDHPESVKPLHFSKDAFDYLYNCYDLYRNIGADFDISINLPLWRHKPKKTVLAEIVFEDSQSQTGGASYTQKVLFYAQTEYLLKVKKHNKEYFSDWMRVVRNLVSLGSIDKDGKRPDIIRSPQTFDGIINLIHELSIGCDNIYEYLYSQASLKSTFAKDQIEEEKVKAKIIKQKPELKRLIWDVEDNELLRGRIEFILYCIDYNNNPDQLNVQLMSKIQAVFQKYFNEDGSVPPGLRRAMLTIEINGAYEFYNYWWSFWNVISATKRKLFETYRELEYFIYSDQKEYFKKLILLLCTKDFYQIISEFQPPESMPKWKVRLIKEDLLEKMSRSNFIAIPDDNSCCYLLKSKRPRDMYGCVKID